MVNILKSRIKVHETMLKEGSGIHKKKLLKF